MLMHTNWVELHSHTRANSTSYQPLSDGAVLNERVLHRLKRLHTRTRNLFNQQNIITIPFIWDFACVMQTKHDAMSDGIWLPTDIVPRLQVPFDCWKCSCAFTINVLSTTENGVGTLGCSTSAKTSLP